MLTTVHSFAHYGMIYVPIGSRPEFNRDPQPRGGSYFGAGTFSAHDGSRKPSSTEKSMARYQGSYFASKVRQFVCA